jgi:hypothetical protein
MHLKLGRYKVKLPLLPKAIIMKFAKHTMIQIVTIDDFSYRNISLKWLEQLVDFEKLPGALSWRIGKGQPDALDVNCAIICQTFVQSH